MNEEAEKYTPEELEENEADWKEMERIMTECPHSHKFEDLDPEDGCIYCGFYSK